MPMEDRKNNVTKENLEKEPAGLTEKDESIESTAANDDNILEQQQDTTDPNVIGEENSILRHSELDDTKTEVANTNEEVDQDNEIQSPVSPGYVTPPERSEPDNISEDLTEQKDGANLNETLSNNYESIPEESAMIDEHEDNKDSPLEVPSGDDENLVGSLLNDDMSSRSDNTKIVSDNNFIKQGDEIDGDTNELESEGEESEHEVVNNNSQSREESPSSDENLGDDNVGVTEHNGKCLHKGNDTEAKKKAFKSPFANFFKGENALLLFLALSSDTFAASFVSSILGKPLCPDKKGNLISLAILGTVTAILVTISLVHFLCPNKSKENGPSSELNHDEIKMPMQENKKNR